MSFKKLSLALLTASALSGVAVSSASAAATTTAAQWYVLSTPLTLAVGTSKPVVVQIGNDPGIGENVRLKSVVGASNTLIDLTATGIECVGCVIENKKARSNKEKEPVTAESIVATGSGRMRFFGVTADTPENCVVKSEDGVVGQVITKPLRVHADFMNGTTAVQEFFPAAEKSETFATFELEGAKCPVTGLYLVKGKLFSDAVTISAGKETKKETGKPGKAQEARISPAIETADGGGLFIGSKAAELTGTAAFSLSTTEEFQIK